VLGQGKGQEGLGNGVKEGGAMGVGRKGRGGREGGRGGGREGGRGGEQRRVGGVVTWPCDTVPIPGLSHVGRVAFLPPSLFLAAVPRSTFPPQGGVRTCPQDSEQVACPALEATLVGESGFLEGDGEWDGSRGKRRGGVRRRGRRRGGKRRKGLGGGEEGGRTRKSVLVHFSPGMGGKTSVEMKVSAHRFHPFLLRPWK
jgi:hypothetical protein